jgi:hypothetical protein
VNNSLERLLDGMVSTMDEHIIPNLQDDFARGQAFGVIYMLRCIRKRAAWSTGYLRAQVDALQAVSAELQPLLTGLPGVPAISANLSVSAEAGEADLEHARDEINRSVCAAYEGFEQHHGALPAAVVSEVREAWERYLTVQLKTELKFNVSLNFSEISTGQATAKAG